MADSGKTVDPNATPDAKPGAPAPSGKQPPPPPPAPAPARAGEKPEALADPPAPDAPSADDAGETPDPKDAAQNASDLVDNAVGVLNSLDPTVVTPTIKQLVALLSSAQDSIGKLTDALGGGGDPTAAAATDAPADAPIAPAPGDNPPNTKAADAAQAVEATLDAAAQVAESIDPMDNDELNQALQLVGQAEEAADQVLDGLGISDPDDDPDYKGPKATSDADSGAAPTDKPTPQPKPAAPAPKTAPASSRTGRKFDEQGGDSQRFKMPVMALEGVDTGDGRRINAQALTWRELPQPLMAITKTTMGHDDAELVGRIETIERVDASQITDPKTGEPYGEGVYALVGEGTFTDLANATEVASLIGDGFLRGVSVDIGDVVSELQSVDGGELDDDDFLDLLFGGGDFVEVLIEGRVMGCTVCPFPAFEGAYIELADGTATDPAVEDTAPSLAASARPAKRIAVRIRDVRGARHCAPCQEGKPLTASAGPMYPPKTWFIDPQLDGPTPMTITDDGRIFGHLAAWGDCHTGFAGHCVVPPHSKMDYGMFMTGEILTRDGELMPIGNITMDTGHAGGDLSAAAAMAHYDDTGTVIADVAVGEDQYGIWYSGAMRPDVDELRIRKLRASGLSGDWRQQRGNLELIAALAVNVQGYPRPRSRVASGAPVSLVAAGGMEVLAAGIKQSNPQQLRRYEELRRVSSWVDQLVNERIVQLRNRVHNPRLDAMRKRVHSVQS
jgi:hypothetical protein